MIQCWSERQIHAGCSVGSRLDLTRNVAILTESIRAENGYGVMVAVTIGVDGVMTSTELDETVVAFGEETKKYVTLTESLGSACSKCGISMRTSGRVGRGYFSPDVRGNYDNPPSSPARVSMIQWIDAKNSDTVRNTFEDML